MRSIILSVAALGVLAAAGGPTDASAQEQCFDKGTLSYVDCPQPAPPPAPVLPPPPLLLWEGFYVGGHAGYAFADADVTLGGLGTAELDLDSPLAGGQVGYNYQFNEDWMIGLEADISYLFDAEDSFSGVNTVVTTAPVVGAAPVTVVTQTPFGASAEINYLASIRARVGHTNGEWLAYLTGGVGFADWEGSAFNGAASATFDEFAVGAVGGAGVEYLVTEEFVAGVEGLYYFFDEEETVGFATTELDNVFSIRARLSYKF
ncbi:MAG: outer membrane beta-barrel protein [Pseudomonadota bacterium]